MLEALWILFESIVDRIQDKLGNATADIGRIQRPQEDEDTQHDVLTQHEIRITAPSFDFVGERSTLLLLD